jgi:CRP/FNR family transcriptional regulator, cyclic AMP receptor protein
MSECHLGAGQMALPARRHRAHPSLMGTAALSTLLAETWFAASLSADTRARLAALGRVVDLPEGLAVVQEGAPCQDMGLVVSGRIALRLSLPGELHRTILTLEAGDVFGWSAVLPPAIATSTGIAIAPSRAILFDGDRLRKALAVDCELAAAIYQRLLASVARRLVATRVQLLDLYRSSTEPW